MSEMVERIARWYMPAAWEHETKWALEWRKKSISRAREVLSLMRDELAENCGASPETVWEFIDEALR